ncbi:hypothetical protein CEP54_011687 [Fusarium duplospermum]|uniref:Uncharacterized protein n=1 Tax=Fusarium duplospermum TaxID=1325734 RepID=A0A428PD34_9HYPO|nr:hypothetical protein CEP54_011687 [Fusarium duplospermum]
MSSQPAYIRGWESINWENQKPSSSSSASASQSQSVSSMTCEPDTDSVNYQTVTSRGKSPKEEDSRLSQDFSVTLLGVGGKFE